MTVSRTWDVLRKDLRLGPRSPFVLWALVLPVVVTLLVQGLFGSLLGGESRLGIVDQGASAIPAQARALDGIEVTELASADTLRERVGANDLDAGLVLPEGFDEAVRAGQSPQLEFFVGGESLASRRIVLAVTALDLVRSVAGEPAPVEVEVVSLGEETVELSTRMLPLLVVVTVAIAGTMVPAASLVDEKEHQTLQALLVTPVAMNDVLTAKGVFGLVLAVATGAVTLALNGAFGGAPLALMLALGVGALMMVEVGLMLGAWARDTATLFTAWKAGGILLLYPAVFFLIPSAPDWAAKTGPSYWFLKPVFDLSVNEATLADVADELLVALAITVALAPLVGVVGRWLEHRLGRGALSTRSEGR